MPVKTAEFRIVTRMSDNGRVYVAEDDNNNYVVVVDGELYGTFQFKTDANKAFGLVTRGLAKDGEEP